MADFRYGVIAGACREAISISNERRRQLSDTIDKYVTNRFLGVPIFLVMMYLVFMFTFTVGQYPMDWLEMLFGALGNGINSIWPAGQAEFLRALLVRHHRRRSAACWCFCRTSCCSSSQSRFWRGPVIWRGRLS